jgi:hypothetical protein
MKTRRIQLLAIAAIGLAAMATCASQATAQSSGGKFTLPHEVRWQGTALPAGDYTFSLKAPELPAIMSVQGPNGKIFIFASSMDEGAINRRENSTLTIEQRGGTSFISEIYLADLNLHIFYKGPKVSKSEQLLAKDSGKKEQVLIASAAR